MIAEAPLPARGGQAQTSQRETMEAEIPTGFDRTAIAGKQFPLAGQVQLAVVGAGPAGIAAASEAARLGLSVLLVDEHPLAPGLIGLDVPYMFGERLGAAVQSPGRMIERIVAARPGLAEAFDAGVDVRLGVAAWGAFVEGPTSQALPCRMLALADAARSWLVGFERIIVAAGARDLGMAFPGWDRPGVMGAQGFGAAVELYGAFAGRRVVVLGGGAAALRCVRQARAAGIEVVAVVSPSAVLPELAECGCEVLAGWSVVAVEGGGEVAGVRVAAPGGAAQSLACDTIVSAVDVVPTVELFDLLGCRMGYDATRGGHLPVIDGAGRCSVAGVYAAGDCVGIGDAGLLDPALAAASGLRAARAAAGDAGIAVESGAAEMVAGPDRDAWRREWLAAHAADGSLTLCRCEEVAVRDVLGVRPPRYLDFDAARFVGRDVRTLAAEGPLNQDQIKRLTRAGMGPCQGRRCREQVQTLLAMQGNASPAAIPMPSYRAPLRPIPLSVLSADDETADVRANWTGWFGIAAQWLPHWEKVPENPEYWGGRIFSGAEE